MQALPAFLFDKLNVADPGIFFSKTVNNFMLSLQGVSEINVDKLLSLAY